MNAVEREPVETRVLNPTASEASYKPKQRSYRTTNLKKKFRRRIVPAPKCPAPKCPAPKRRQRIGGAETYPTLKFKLAKPLLNIFIFGFKYSFYSSGQGKSSAVLCGPPISLEKETNYPYLHGWPQKYSSAEMWADRILGARTLFFLDSLFCSYVVSVCSSLRSR